MLEIKERSGAEDINMRVLIDDIVNMDRLPLGKYVERKENLANKSRAHSILIGSYREKILGQGRQGQRSCRRPT